MTREFYNFGNFKELMDEDCQEELQSKENEDFKNIWKPSKDENPFYNVIKEKFSDLSYESQPVLVESSIQYKGPYICPITLKEYTVQPFFDEQLKDIDEFICAVYDEVVFIYKHSFLYEENNYACIPFSELLRLEKEYRKRWNKIKKTRKTKSSTNAARTVAKSSCWVIQRLLKQYKYYIHLKYLRGLFVKNEGNRITYRITQKEFGEMHFPTTVITSD